MPITFSTVKPACLNSSTRTSTQSKLSSLSFTARFGTTTPISKAVRSSPCPFISLPNPPFPPQNLNKTTPETASITQTPKWVSLFKPEQTSHQPIRRNNRYSAPQWSQEHPRTAKLKSILDQPKRLIFWPKDEMGPWKHWKK